MEEEFIHDLITKLVGDLINKTKRSFSLYNLYMYINNHEWKEGIVFWDQEVDKSKDIDVFYLLHEFNKDRGGNVSEHINFKSVLDTDTPELRFSSSVRRKWRKLPTNIDYTIKGILSESEIKEIVKQFNLFAEKMHLTKMDGGIYNQMNDDKKLFVTEASIKGVIQYIHVFYVSDGISRLFHTFPTNECISRDINIGLHRFDLLAFKDKGINTYDWGGAGFINESNEKKLAIREYKRRFGGQEFTYYKARIAGNEKGKKIIAERYKF